MADPDADKGFYGKYVVERKDGSHRPGGKHEKCLYFVLDLHHDRFAPAALLAYAEMCELEYPKLAADLRRFASAAGWEQLKVPMEVTTLMLRKRPR